MKIVTRGPDGRTRVQSQTSGKSLVDVSAGDRTKVREVVKRFNLLGRAPMSRGQYSDVPLVSSLEDVLNAKVRVKEAFEALPLKVRKRFGSPEAAAMFALDPSNKDEAIKLGLLVPNAPKAEGASGVRGGSEPQGSEKAPEPKAPEPKAGAPKSEA